MKSGKSNAKTKTKSVAKSTKGTKVTKKRRKRENVRVASLQVAPAVEARRPGVQHTVRLGDRTVGAGVPTIVVAGICVEHYCLAGRAEAPMKAGAGGRAGAGE